MGGTILLADDSLTIQKVVELTFAESEHTVVAVGGGRELFERLATVNPDVILCDVVMPDMTGYEVCQAVKSDPTRLHIPVVLLTGTFEPFDRDRAMASGCDAIVTKPFEARELIDTVEKLIARTKGLAMDAAAAELEGLGVPDGVPALDFTTTGFDKMVPPPPAPPAPPDEGIELTASVGKPVVVAVPEPPPPPVAPEAGEGTAPPFLLEPEAHEGQTGGSEPWEGGEPVVPVATPAPEPAELFPAPEPAAPPRPAPVAPEPARAEAAARAPELQAELQLSDEQIDRIARRVVELAAPQLEKIAWEVIPDMAEMIVRQRIRELEEAAEREN